MNELAYALAGISAVVLAPRAYRRIQLSLAKHPSLRGHAKMSRLLARLLPFYEYDDAAFFSSDGAPAEVSAKRRGAFDRLAEQFAAGAPESIAFTEALRPGVSDMQFTSNYRVPFQYRNLVRDKLKVGAVADASRGTQIRDLDGNWSYDLFGSYGVNVFGYDFYRACLDRGIERVRDLGPVLGPYHPVIADNVQRLQEISGLDEVSFHMSGTEAVMQAVRLARFHTGRERAVVFCGAYHGWWEGVQPGVGSVRKVGDVYTLKEMSEATLKVLRTRRDIACVLVNPLQAMHPNSGAPGDATLVASDRSAAFDKEAYSEWLRELRAVCSQRGIVLIFDEVFVGFRLALGGAQEYFGVRADMVTYGKSLGGGLPVGVVCGRHELMQRFRPDKPSDICFARGTFNSHPYVMGAMNEFLQRVQSDDMRARYATFEAVWNRRISQLNSLLEEAGVPVRIENLMSVCTILYTQPGRYNWMFQFYLRAEGLSLSWIGSGRLIFSHDYSDEEFTEVAGRIVAAATTMRDDGWWWESPSLTNKSIKRRILRELFDALR